MKKILAKPVWIELLPLFIIIAVSLAVYSNALGNGFVYDDEEQVLANQWITDARYLPQIFTNNVWGFKEGASNFYRPMMHVIYMMTHYLFGLRPWGFHLVSVVFHIGSSVLVFLIAGILFKEQSSRPKLLSTPLMAALLFAVHPIHTEAVAWVAAIPDLSYSFFCLTALYLYLRSENGFNASYAFSVVSFFVGTLCKEPALMLPVLLVAYDLLLSKRTAGLLFLIKRHALFALTALIYLGVRFYALSRTIAPVSNNVEYSSYGNIFVLFSAYLTKLAIPVNLKFSYSFQPVESFLDAHAAAAIIFTLLVAASSYVAYNKNRLVFFFLLLVVVPLLPCFYTPALSWTSVMADRYLYLPSAGFSMLLALMVASLASSRGATATALVFFSFASCFSVGTITRNADWKDNYTLWSDEVKKSPWSADAHKDLGLEYGKRGQDELAVVEFLTALKCDPFIEGVYKNLGIAYGKMGKGDEAIRAFEESLSAEPDDAEAHNNLAIELVKKGDLKNAISHFQAAVSLAPENSRFKGNLETALRETKNKSM